VTDAEVEVALTMVECVAGFDRSYTAFSANAYASHEAYSQARNAYISDVRRVVLASRALHDAIAADDVRRAAEAGSPAARMFEPNGGK